MNDFYEIESNDCRKAHKSEFISDQNNYVDQASSLERFTFSLPFKAYIIRANNERIRLKGS